MKIYHSKCDHVVWLKYSFFSSFIGDPAGFIQPLTRSRIQSNAYTYEEHFKTVRGSLPLLFFGRLFFAVSRPCVVVEITPATVSPYSSFSNNFFENSTIFSRCCFFCRLFFAVLLLRSLQPQFFRYTPRFRTVFSKIRQVVTSSVSSFALCCSAVLL